MQGQDKPSSARPFTDHTKRGRRLSPPLVAATDLTVSDWVRDDLPDLLWPVLLLGDRGDQAIRAFVQWQKAVVADLNGEVDGRELADGLDGRLTGLARLVARHPSAAESISLRVGEFDLMPPSVRSVLSSYPQSPAEWFVGEFHSPDQADVDLLKLSLEDVLRSAHREALIKCLSVWVGVITSSLSVGQNAVDLLRNYPNEPERHVEADTAISAMWGSMRQLRELGDHDYWKPATDWARVFWGTNSMTTRCVRTRDLDAGRADNDVPDSEDPATNTASSSALPATGFQQRAMDLTSSYIEAIEAAPRRLYDPEREEVNTGLVVRAARAVVNALGNESLWSPETGAHIGRMLVETQILLKWMAAQDQKLIYKQYKDFGAGKAKLYSTLARELPQGWLVPGLQDAVNAIKDASHNEPIDIRVVDLSASFSGKTMRTMAQECGLEDLYRHAYQLESGIVHSEWWSVELHSMEPCLNVLHRGHLIPKLEAPVGGSADLGRGWLIALYSLIQVSLQILNVPEAQVREAFGWLDAQPQPQDAWRNG